MINRNRDEVTRPPTRVRRDDGRFKRPDCPYLKSGRSGLKIGTWNVRTLNQFGKIENLKQEAEHLDIDILGISETRYKEEGTVRRTMVEMSKKYWLKKSTSGLVVKIQNGHQKPVFRQ